MAMIGPVISRIARPRATRGRRQPLLLHDALNVLNHHDRVVDNDADRQHKDAEQRDGVGRMAKRMNRTAKKPVSDTGAAMVEHPERLRQLLPRKKHDEHDKGRGSFGQGPQHFDDRRLDEGRAVENDLMPHVGRIALRQLIERIRR